MSDDDANKIKQDFEDGDLHRSTIREFLSKSEMSRRASFNEWLHGNLDDESTKKLDAPYKAARIAVARQGLHAFGEIAWTSANIAIRVAAAQGNKDGFTKSIAKAVELLTTNGNEPSDTQARLQQYSRWKEDPTTFPLWNLKARRQADEP
jgi:hypothetical protein